MAVGIFGRGYWTPDEPREEDIAWRMSFQADKAVPLLAGEAFCEKPPLTYWIAGAAIGAWGADARIARLPNLVYALITALAVYSLGRRSAGKLAGIAAAAAISTLLLSYQVAIWLATDAPLLAAVAVAQLGLYVGFYAANRRERLRGYTGMHAALALGFLSKSAAAWMVPVLTLLALVIWERRFRELWRWELYVGGLVQAAIILPWVGFVYAGADGPAHLKVFFWNNLAGRFTHVDAPEALQYAGAHRNSPGKYLIELPTYLWPWTLLVLAAARRAWRQRHQPEDGRPLRFALATFVPTLTVLSMAATARNIYLAPALPGIALLLGWWFGQLATLEDAWDARAVRATSALLALAALVFAFAVVVVGRDSWDLMHTREAFVAVSVIGLAASVACAVSAWRAAGGRPQAAASALLLAYCALLVGPASQLYGRVDTWQDLESIGRAVGRDAHGRPLVLFAADETTRALIDMYAGTSATFIPGPIGASAEAALRRRLAEDPQSVIVSQLPSQNDSRTLRQLAAVLGLATRWAAVQSDARAPPWAADVGLHVEHVYSLPNGRRYALLAAADSTNLSASRGSSKVDAWRTLRSSTYRNSFAGNDPAGR
jgi:4-amino-4-deoxy-L-arabinose transferase-like glycosyltransferase